MLRVKQPAAGRQSRYVAIALAHYRTLFFDFVKLEQRARCVLSDSGTALKERSIFNAPNVTLRDVTERAETLEVGSNILTGAEPEMILGAVRMALETSAQWSPPAEYVVGEVARTVVKVVLGYQTP